jgi:beta-galactosidase
LIISALSPLAAMAATAEPSFASTPASTTAGTPTAEPVPGGIHTFGFAADGSNFLLDGAPFQIRSGEMHPSRIPVEYWRHRVRMAKAMGLNTVSLYVMWNYIEESPGVYDFSTDRRNVEAFVKLCQDEGMWVLLRPGPYVCGEWDLGGIPPYLLGVPGIQLRVNSTADSHYMAAVSRYYAQLIPRVQPLLAANGGPILMIQIENEYGSYGNDQAYVEELRRLWLDAGVAGPFYTEDGLGQVEANHTNVPGGAIGLSGGDAGTIASCRQAFPDVPAFGGEVYPGWLTHWGDSTFQGQNSDVTSALKGFMDGGLSFNLYMLHGGTSFGYFAGANANNDGSNYQPDITSYDYSAPITEQGVATAKYTRYRDLIAGYLSAPPPDVPAPVPTITRSGGDLMPKPFASVWDNLPPALPANQTVDPQPMEMYGQNAGFVLYRKVLDGFTGGQLSVDEVHDYATVFVNGAYQGGLSRPALPPDVATSLNLTGTDAPLTLDTPAAGESATLDIFVEGMGRINYGHGLVDRKGITGTVALKDAGALSGTVIGWQVYLLPMDATFIQRVRRGISDPNRPGLLFMCEPNLTRVADTYIDMSGWTKGVVWVNGNNLGRYWQIGPQHRLYCPASWLRRGRNEIVIFDHHQTEAKPIAFADTLA